MENNNTQQEILFVTTTSFSKRQFHEPNAPEGSHQLSGIEQLEEAFWHGLLDILFSDLMEKTASGNHLCLWHVRKGNDFLQMELSESFPISIEKQSSIDSNFFLPTLEYN